MRCNGDTKIHLTLTFKQTYVHDRFSNDDFLSFFFLVLFASAYISHLLFFAKYHLQNATESTIWLTDFMHNQTVVNVYMCKTRCKSIKTIGSITIITAIQLFGAMQFLHSFHSSFVFLFIFLLIRHLCFMCFSLSLYTQPNKNTFYSEQFAHTIGIYLFMTERYDTVRCDFGKFSICTIHFIYIFINKKLGLIEISSAFK